MKIIVTSSTFPAHAKDPVPAFVLDQVEELSRIDKKLELHVLIPHNAYSEKQKNRIKKPTHTETRYHYFWPHKHEKLTGRGIMPALKENPMRYGLIPFFLLSQRRALKKLCDEVKPDLIYAHWFMPQALVAAGLARKMQVPLVFTTHSSDVIVLKKVPFASNLIARYIKKTAAFTAVSNRTVAKMKTLLPGTMWSEEIESKLHVIPMGTKTSKTKMTSTQAQKHLQKAGLDTSKKIIFTMGRLVEIKGINYLIKAIAALPPADRKKCQLAIAGDGQDAEKLKNLSQELGVQTQVIFLGYISGDLKESLLQAADIFVMSSIVDSRGDSEGLPVALMEALANGKLVIATDASGSEEVIDKTSGIAVKEKSSKEITKAISKLLSLSDQEREQMVNSAKKAAARFDLNLVARQHLELFKKVTKEYERI